MSNLRQLRTAWQVYADGHSGTCMSFADGHSEYRRWKDPVTIAYGRWREETNRTMIPPGSAIPEDPKVGNLDYDRVHKEIWGKGP